MSSGSAKRTFVVAAIILSLCGSAPNADAQHAGRPTRVLLLYQQQAETQPMLEFGQQLRATIREDLGSAVEFYQEALDFDRFTGREHSSPLARYFDDKYRAFGIDVVVPVGGRALQFAVDELGPVLPNVPVVFALCAAPQTNPAAQPANVTGRIASASRFAPTLWMARRLQPDARQLVVVGGAGPQDSVAVSAVVRAAHPLADSLTITTLQGFSLDALLPKLRQLPRRAIVVFASYRQDGNGHAYEPLDIIGSIARASSAPMYTQLRSYVGEGVVGGSVTRFDDEGMRTGKLVVRVLRLRSGEPMPPVEPIVNSFVADWRQVQHWGLSEKRLPPGTAVVFREPTAWQRYRSIILLAVLVTAAEAVLIGSLLLERRRRKGAQLLAEEKQRHVEESRRQVAHLGRVALVGELAATIAHELRQPLTAIRANAETGAKFMRRSTGHIGAEAGEVCAEIFGEIVTDTASASDIITRIRALLRREELPQGPVDLNEVCRTSARLLQHDAETRKAQIALSLEPRLPIVTGDPVQLQQVVLNLVMNALDASVASANPRVVVSTIAHDEEVEVVVQDNGPGLPPGVQERLFESFFTTKSHGLGLGLAIVQSIVERHQGSVRAENGDQAGAIFRVVVPCARSVRIVPSTGALKYVESRVAVPK